MSDTASVLYDADGNEIDDEARAVRGVVYELDDDGNRGAVLEEWHAEGSGDIGAPASR
jgi:hypothetical protein